MDIERLKTLAISDSGFVFDPVTGHSFTTNSVGIDIIKLLKSGADPVDVADSIMQDYEVIADDAERDVGEFVDMLKKLTLI